MDRNKAVYKLKNFGPVYYLNLDEQPERKIYMEAQFKYWEIKTIQEYLHMMVEKMTLVIL